MAARAQPLIDTRDVPIAATTVFTATDRTTIDAVVVNNTTATPLTFTANIVKSGTAVATANQVMSSFSIGANASTSPLGMLGQTLNPGDFISVLGSAAGLNIRASGRVLSNA